MTQDAAHEEFCWTFPLYRPSRSLEQFRTQGLESTAGQRCARKSIGLHRDQISLTRTGERWKVLHSHRILRIEGSAEHSRCTCVDRLSRSHHEQLRTQGSAHRAY